ncbi:MAG: hypothetical protein NT062_21000 [Proteobacteria bacterium]|nr:hypothetical protein [Pseudomonadota bacterium]
MSDTHTSTSANGAWDLRATNDFEPNTEGYGVGGWTFELIERATGRVARTWSGWATTSPWSESSMGTRAVVWDGDVLVVVEDDDTELRITPA